MINLTWATKSCPHCGERRNMTGFVEGLWEANNSDEVRYYLFHEPYQFLSEYWKGRTQAYVKGLDQVKLQLYFALFTPGELNQVWGDGHGGWSHEYIELFPDPINSEIATIIIMDESIDG